MKTLGLIAGMGELPKLVAEEAREKGYRVFAIALEPLADKNLSDHVDSVNRISVGKLGEIIDTLMRHASWRNYFHGRDIKARVVQRPGHGRSPWIREICIPTGRIVPERWVEDVVDGGFWNEQAQAYHGFTLWLQGFQHAKICNNWFGVGGRDNVQRVLIMNLAGGVHNLPGHGARNLAAFRDDHKLFSAGQPKIIVILVEPGRNGSPTTRTAG